MPDPRFHPRDPRSRDRADNAGFSIVLVLGGCLALGLLALTMTDHVSSQRTGATHDGRPANLALR